ncbi:unnamed protein product [Euphydryas editha]|uniref:Uncharacterized protein n=1 Tax=Euphydryas editha TaxID=104508 RepID=A0AAU9TWL5_EUPED|nr:unnamed protein product [Euphydryas editha]
MLAWGTGRGGAGSSRCPALPVPLEEHSSEDDSSHDPQSALLAGTVARARRRHAIKVKRKSKIAFRALSESPRCGRRMACECDRPVSIPDTYPQQVERTAQHFTDCTSDYI